MLCVPLKELIKYLTMTRGEVRSFLARKRDLRYQHLTIDASNKCTLLCSQCRRQSNKFLGFPSGENGRDITLSDVKKLSDYFYVFDFCGQVSDPIFCEEFIEILEYLYQIDRYTTVHTAATAKNRNREWYEKAFKANPKAHWIFGIDGLPEESHLYRVGQDGKFLFEMMKLARSMGLNPRWQYIVFKYNENDIERCAKIAEDEGITFEVNVTNRWDEDLKPNNPRWRI